MIDYIQRRYSCEPCGTFHSLIQRPGEAAPRWRCPGCKKRSEPTHECKGSAVKVKFGYKLTHVMVVPKGRAAFNQTKFPKPYEGAQA